MSLWRRLFAGPDTFADPDDWRILRTLAGYRVLLAALLLTLHTVGYSPYFFDQLDMRSFFRTMLAYAAAGLLLLPLLHWRRPRLTAQAHLGLAIDTVVTVCLVYSAGGVSSGLGMLLVTPVICGSLVLTLRMALLHAALATLAMFGEELWRQAHTAFMPSELTETGLLGLMLFVVALAGGAVSNRARRSEALAVRAGSDLANLSRLNERIVESMETGALVVDEERRLRLVNAAARRLLGGDGGAIGTPLATAFPALASALDRWDRGAVIDTPPFVVQPSGPELIPRFTRLGASAWTPVLVQIDDAARVREAAQQLKLAALGRLSAGVAHEIRNPLSAIQHAGQLLAESPQLDAGDQRLIDIIRRHSVRIDRIVEDVLDLSRRDAAEPSTLSLREFLENSVAVYREGCPQRVCRLIYDEVPHDLLVRFDPGQLQQILHNLWDNSFAHGAEPGSSVTITLSGGRLHPGQHPYLDVSDDGRGIPQELEDRIFEPFFSAGTNGTGLGLYLSRELCDYNRARLIYVPREHGACFRIVFAAA
jgi:two-component system sensor histidine kinase PilS (NtrC family)